MGLWSLPGVPHKGWYSIGCEDVGKAYETCQMCGYDGIRYVHSMKHPEYDGVLRVGRICAEKMSDDYVTYREREASLKNLAARKSNFLKRPWYRNWNGNWVFRYKGERITAIQRNGRFGFVFHNRWAWSYKGKSIRDMATLKQAAFEMFDQYNMWAG